MEERVRGHGGEERGSWGRKGREGEVRDGGERVKWPSYTVVNLPKTSSASRQGLSSPAVRWGRGAGASRAYASWEIFKAPCVETCIYKTHLKPVVVSACFVFSKMTRGMEG